MDIHPLWLLTPLAGEGHAPCWQEAGSEKNPAFPSSRSPVPEQCGSLCWNHSPVAGELRQLAWGARLRSGCLERAEGTGPVKGPSQLLKFAGLSQQNPQQTSVAVQRDSKTQNASISLCKEPWPKANQRDPEVKVGPAFRGKQNTRDTGGCTMALFKIIIETKSP